jgi:hypothetical protein
LKRNIKTTNKMLSWSIVRRLALSGMIAYVG